MDKIDFFVPTVDTTASQYFGGLVEQFLQNYLGDEEIARNLLIFVFQFKRRISKHAFATGKTTLTTRREKSENVQNEATFQGDDFQFSTDYSSSSSDEEEALIAPEEMPTTTIQTYPQFQFTAKTPTKESIIVGNLFHSLTNRSNLSVHPCFHSLVHSINHEQNPYKLQILKSFFLQNPKMSFAEIVSFLTDLRKELVDWNQLNSCTLLAQFKFEQDFQSFKTNVMQNNFVKEELSWFLEDEFPKQFDEILSSYMNISFSECLASILEFLKEKKLETSKWKKHQQDLTDANNFYLLKSKNYFDSFCNFINWLLESQGKGLISFYSNFSFYFGCCKFVPRRAELDDSIQQSLAKYFWVWEFEFVPKEWRSFSIPLSNLVLYQKILISILYLNKLFSIQYKRLTLVNRLKTKELLHSLSWGFFCHNTTSTVTSVQALNFSETLYKLLQLFQSLS